MKNITGTLFFIAALAAFAGCNTDPGPDSISSHTGGEGGGSGTISNCTTVCHIPGGTLGPDPLATNGTGTAGKHVAHVASRGLACTKCHYQYDIKPEHFNGIVNSKGVGQAPVYFDATNPTGVWSFTTPSGPGTCSSTICHQNLTPDWYGTAVPAQDPVCSNCHSTSINLRRTVMGAAGDFATNPSVTSSHVAGGGDPSSGQCTVCHDQSLHMSGTVRLSHADTGTRIDYDPVNPATLELFCLSCHDADGALATALTASALSPFNDGTTLGAIPYMASTTVASSWNGSSMHRSRGLTCAGTGSPNTGCHGRNGAINAHGSITKGLLTNAMNFQIPLVDQATYLADPLGTSYSYDNYRLCFDCHAAYPAVAKETVLGYRQGGAFDLPTVAPTPYFTIAIQSRFRDRYINDPANYPAYWSGINQPYNDIITTFGQPNLPLHNYHLLGFMATFPSPTSPNILSWKYRGDPAAVGRITCMTCHSIHGNAVATIRGTYQELGLQSLGLGPGLGQDDYVTFTNTTALSSFPTNCSTACHGPQGPTSYWHTPSGE
ncbi:MAG: hypothetical protein ACYC7L_05270 [Nitrospirota bacterium]